VGRFPLLDVIIGLTLIYTFLSLLASELTEFLTTVLQWRAKHLQKGIMTLLGEPLELRHDSKQFKDTLTCKLYQSSLIASITHRSARKLPIGPSYISAEVFAEALLEVLQSLPEVKNDAAQELNAVSQLMLKVEHSSELPPQLKANLQRLVKQAQVKTNKAELLTEQFKHEISIWFEQSMVHVSGVYRRNVKLFTITISSILAILINADSVYMIRRISENTATRSVIIQNAIQIEGCQNNLSSPVCMNNMASLLESTTIPIGWHSVNQQMQFPQLSITTLTRAVIGWLLTGIAISMGSRFWFQLLGKLVQVRETGEKPRPLDRSEELYEIRD
jgi:hypothetical protein